MSGAEIGGLIVFGAMFALVGVLFCLQHRLYARLRSVHPEQYERLGSPTLFLNNSISNGFKTMRFFWSRGYRHLDDPKATRLCRSIVVIPPVRRGWAAPQGLTAAEGLARRQAAPSDDLALPRQVNHSGAFVDALTAFGAVAVTAMMVRYGLASRHRTYILAFAGACVASSVHGFMAGTWPFGVVEAVWALVAVRRW
jgi:hypothetical protein